MRNNQPRTPRSQAREKLASAFSVSSVNSVAKAEFAAEFTEHTEKENSHRSSATVFLLPAAYRLSLSAQHSLPFIIQHSAFIIRFAAAAAKNISFRLH